MGSLYVLLFHLRSITITHPGPFHVVFNNPRKALLGVMSAAYSLGAMVALPFVPTITDRFGRRFAITFGSVIMVIGAALQTASVHRA